MANLDWNGIAKLRDRALPRLIDYERVRQSLQTSHFPNREIPDLTTGANYGVLAPGNAVSPSLQCLRWFIPRASGMSIVDTCTWM
ncbi:MAG: hypothetical protein WA324_17270 [Bryobacteraceae bacterium]